MKTVPSLILSVLLAAVVASVVFPITIHAADVPKKEFNGKLRADRLELAAKLKEEIEPLYAAIPQPSPEVRKYLVEEEMRITGFRKSDPTRWTKEYVRFLSSKERRLAQVKDSLLGALTIIGEIQKEKPSFEFANWCALAQNFWDAEGNTSINFKWLVDQNVVIPPKPKGTLWFLMDDRGDSGLWPQVYGQQILRDILYENLVEIESRSKPSAVGDQK